MPAAQRRRAFQRRHHGLGEQLALLALHLLQLPDVAERRHARAIGPACVFAGDVPPRRHDRKLAEAGFAEEGRVVGIRLEVAACPRQAFRLEAVAARALVRRDDPRDLNRRLVIAAVPLVMHGAGDVRPVDVAPVARDAELFDELPHGHLDLAHPGRDHAARIQPEGITAERGMVGAEHVVLILEDAHRACAEDAHVEIDQGQHVVEIARREDGQHALRDVVQPHLHGLGTAACQGRAPSTASTAGPATSGRRATRWRACAPRTGPSSR